MFRPNSKLIYKERFDMAGLNYFIFVGIPFLFHVCRFKWINKLLLMVLIDVRPFTTQHNLLKQTYYWELIFVGFQFGIGGSIHFYGTAAVYFIIYWVDSYMSILILNGGLKTEFSTLLQMLERRHEVQYSSGHISTRLYNNFSLLNARWRIMKW